MKFAAARASGNLPPRPESIRIPCRGLAAAHSWPRPPRRSLRRRWRPPRPPARSTWSIVGAGAAGIAAARRVAAAQRSFRLYEAGTQVGGRCAHRHAIFWRAVRSRRALDSPSRQQSAAQARAPKTSSTSIRRRAGEDMRVGPRPARDAELENFLASLVRVAPRHCARPARGKTDVAAAHALPRDLGDWRASYRIRARALCLRQGSRPSVGASTLRARSSAMPAPSAGRAMARCWRGSPPICRCSFPPRSTPSPGPQLGVWTRRRETSWRAR